MADQIAKALWITRPQHAELQPTPIATSDGDLYITTIFSSISRGTERLIFNGQVPDSEHETMRAPFQEGSFTFPLKYGYAAVGRVCDTQYARDIDRADEIVFSLFPHQTHFTVPPEAAVRVPPNVPAKRAILAANMETALNILWDARISPGDRVAVVGAGVVGALSAYLCAQVPGTEVTLIDIDPNKAALANDLGCHFESPKKATGDVDVVIHASATSNGLDTAISIAGMEATIVEASWYGTKATEVHLGGAFHQRRLQIIGTQVGRIPAHRAARWTYRRRLETALGLLSDPSLDALISGETAFADLPDCYGKILDDPGTLCHRIRYDAE